MENTHHTHHTIKHIQQNFKFRIFRKPEISDRLFKKLINHSLFFFTSSSHRSVMTTCRTFVMTLKAPFPVRIRAYSLAEVNCGAVICSVRIVHTKLKCIIQHKSNNNSMTTHMKLQNLQTCGWMCYTYIATVWRANATCAYNKQPLLRPHRQRRRKKKIKKMMANLLEWCLFFLSTERCNYFRVLRATIVAERHSVKICCARLHIFIGKKRSLIFDDMFVDITRVLSINCR